MPRIDETKVDLADVVPEAKTDSAESEHSVPSLDHIVVPEVVYDSLLRLLDVVIKISEIKDPHSSREKIASSAAKESLVSDFKRYRELKIEVRGKREEDFEDQLLTDFVSRNVFDTFAAEMKHVIGHEKVISLILQYVVDRECANPPQFATPDERFVLARCLPHLLLMIDGDWRSSCFDASSKAYMGARPRGGVKPFQMFCKRYAVIPLIGDQSVRTLSILERSPNFDNMSADLKLKWGDRLKYKFKKGFELQQSWPQIRADFESFGTRFQLMLNRLHRVPFLKELGERNVELSVEVFFTTLEGISLLCQWTGFLQSVMAWKYTHPCELEDLILRFGDEFRHAAGREYEQVVKHNFTPDELSMFADIVSMVKGLNSLMAGAETTIAPILRFHVHHSVQQLVQGDLLAMLHRADKTKNGSMPVMLQIRSVAADWLGGIEARENYKTHKRSKGTHYATHPARMVGPTHTQLSLLRVLVRSLYDDKAHGRAAKGMFGRCPVDKHDVALLRRWYHESFFYSNLMNLGTTLKQCSNLSFLWLREFWLERTRCIQFSIEESMPWLLTEHVTTQVASTAMPETFLHTLDIYNDAANCSLHELGRQHLYDEVEAEASVVLDHLMYMQADEIYKHCKDSAASMCLDHTFKFRMEEIKGRAYLTVGAQRLDFIMRQKHVQLLGRTVDLSYLLAQVVASRLSVDIETSLRKFESSDATGVVELQSMLQVLRETHTLLSKHLDLSSFDDLLREADQNFAPTIKQGRIGAHLAYSLLQDVLANSAYNSFTQRFVRSSVEVRTDVEYTAPKKHWADSVYGATCAKAFKSINELQKGYFGRAHIEAILELCSNELSALLEACKEYLEQKLEILGEMTTLLAQPGGLENFTFEIKLPTSTIEVYRFFNDRLSPLLGIEDIKLEVFQLFREVGNCLYFLKDLSAAVDVRDQFRFIAVAPLLGIVPDTLPSKAPKACLVESPFVTTLNALQQVAERSKDEFQFSVHKLTIQALGAASKRAALLALPPMVHPGEPYVNVSLFQSAIRVVDSAVSKLGLRDVWSRVLPPAKERRSKDRDKKESKPSASASASALKFPTDGPESLFQADRLRPSRFLHIWSSLLFLFNCRNPESSSSSDDEEDGSDPETGRKTISQNQRFESTTDLEVFGHGFGFAGSVLLHVLGQRAAYELTDYSSAILRLRKYEESLPLNVQEALFANVEEEEMEEVNEFIDSLQAQKDLHENVFALLDAQASKLSSAALHTRNPDQAASVGRGVYSPPAVWDD